MQMAQLATISGSMAGDENHHCTKLVKKFQSAPNALRPRLRIPSWRSSHAEASSKPKTFAHQDQEKPRSKSKRKNPQSCGRKNVV